MSDKRAFGRVVEVRLISQGAAPILFEGFDVDFKVEANISSTTANKGDVTLFNLPQEYRAAFQKPEAKLSLTAGYANTSVALLGVYDVQRVASELMGPDWVTQIQCSENLTALRDATISTSFKPGVSKATVYKQLANAMVSFGVTLGNFAGTLGASSGTFPNGVALEGRVASLLEQYARKEGFFFSVQGGELVFLAEDAILEKQITLSPDTGLIGLPEFGEADPANKKPAQIKCRSLLRPEAKAGSKVTIDLPPGEGVIQGRLKANKVTHNGSTYAQSFYTDFECEVLT